MAYSNINAITVVPGAIGAFRKKVLEEVGGFTTDTLAEDCDLTMCINERGYIIENENYAVAMTEVPETLRQFVKQRIRWCFGVMQTFWKHRSSLFATSKKRLWYVGYAKYAYISIHYTNILATCRYTYDNRFVYRQCRSSICLLSCVFACRCKCFL